MGKQIPQLNVFGEVIPATTHLHQFGDGQNFDCVHSDDLYGALLIYTIPQHTFHCQERPGAQMLTSNEAQMFNDTRQKKNECLLPPHPPSPPPSSSSSSSSTDSWDLHCQGANSGEDFA